MRKALNLSTTLLLLILTLTVKPTSPSYQQLTSDSVVATSDLVMSSNGKVLLTYENYGSSSISFFYERQAASRVSFAFIGRKTYGNHRIQTTSLSGDAKLMAIIFSNQLELLVSRQEIGQRAVQIQQTQRINFSSFGKDIDISDDGTTIIVVGEDMMFDVYSVDSGSSGNFTLTQTIDFSAIPSLSYLNSTKTIQHCSISKNKQYIAIKGDFDNFLIFVLSGSNYVLDHQSPLGYSPSSIRISSSGILVTGDADYLYVFQRNQSSYNLVYNSTVPCLNSSGLALSLSLQGKKIFYDCLKTDSPEITLI